MPASATATLFLPWYDSLSVFVLMWRIGTVGRRSFTQTRGDMLLFPSCCAKDGIIETVSILRFLTKRDLMFAFDVRTDNLSFFPRSLYPPPH